MLPSTWSKTGAFLVRAVYDDIAISSDNPDHIYLVVENVGLVWNTDSGKSWRNVWCGTPHHMRSVVIDPLKPNLVHVMYRQNVCVADISEGRELKKIDLQQKDDNFLFLTSHSDKVYATTLGGIFWTNNQWESWTKLDGAGLPQGTPSTSLLFDPKDSNVIYAGGTALRGKGEVPDLLDAVYKTTDGGKSWFAINNGLDKGGVWTLALDPANPLVLYLGSQFGLYRTKDGGASWHFVGLKSDPITAIYIDSADPRIIYAGSVANGLYRTDNGGVSWTNIRLSDFGTPSRFPREYQNYVSAIAASPKDPKTLYVTTGDGLFKVAEGRSVSFVDVRLENGPVGGSSLGEDGGLSDMMASPSDPNVVYVIDRCGEDAYRSIDAGKTWIGIGPSGASLFSLIGSSLIQSKELVGYHDYGMRIAVSPLNS